MKGHIHHLLAQIREEAAIPALVDIFNFCQDAEIELNRPLRIAITGEIKTGKSTLMNAFLGRYISPTAVEVWTYNVIWFHHISSSDDGKEKFTVHYHNQIDESHPLSSLENFVAYNARGQGSLDNIYWVDVFLDHDLLRIFDLIDTPGLKSLIGKDSEHTRNLLTKKENKPDAIIYLVKKKGFQEEDISIVSQYHCAQTFDSVNNDCSTSGLISGIRAVAAITRVDEIEGKYDAANEVIRRNQEDYAEIRYFFSQLLAIAALPAQASYMLNDTEIDTLRVLSMQDDISNYLYDKESFGKLNTISKDEQNRLLEQLTIKGVVLSIDYFQSNKNSSNNEFRSFLYKFSNVGKLEDYIIRHFGRRADFYKCEAVIDGLKSICNRIVHNQKLIGPDRQKALEILRNVNLEDYELHDYYASYYILNDYYNMELYFNEKEWDKARLILGDKGQKDFERLSLSESSNINEIRNGYEKELLFWKCKSHKLHLKGNLKGSEVAKKIAEIIERQILK